MTVSKALRDAKDISPATRTRIRKLATDMGYVPDLSAQLMRSGKTPPLRPDHLRGHESDLRAHRDGD